MGIFNSSSKSDLLSQVNDWAEPQTFKKGINLTGIAVPPGIVEGRIYHYNKRFYLDSDNRRVITRAGNVLTAPVTVSNTTAEVTLCEGTIAVDTLSFGKLYKAWVLGQFSTADASAGLIIRIRLNNIQIASTTTTFGKVTDAAGFVRVLITVRSIGESGAVTCFNSFQLDQKSYIANNSSIPVDSTAGSNVRITAQWSAANTGNIVTIDQSFLEVLN